MEFTNKTKQILYIIAAGAVQAAVMIIIFFAEWYMICVDNNMTVFLASIVLSDVLLYVWHFLYKKVEKLGEDNKDEK